MPGFDWSAWTQGTATERLSLLPAAQEHVLAQEGSKERLLQAVIQLSKAFALAVPHEEAIRIRDDVGFFQSARAAIAKGAMGERKSSGDLDHAIRQIVSRAIASGSGAREPTGAQSGRLRARRPAWLGFFGPLPMSGYAKPTSYRVMENGPSFGAWACRRSMDGCGHGVGYGARNDFPS